MKKVIVAAVVLAALGIAALTVPAAVAKEPAAGDWGALAFLVGEWSGEEGGAMGEGKATVTWTTELGGELLVGRHRIDFPATRKRTGTVEQDMIVIHRDGSGKPTRAMLFDTAHNVTAFTVEVSADGKTITLTSDAQPSVPRHRMTWTRESDKEVSVTHQMASPGKPDEFAPQTAGRMRKQ